MKIFAFAASHRKGSNNRMLVEVAAKLLREKGIEVDLAEFGEFDVPLYNGDLESSDGVPSAAQDFAKRMSSADGMLLATPEYNYSIPGNLKNLIDWVSRVRPMPWDKQKIMLASASPSAVGGNRGLWQTRIPLEGCGAFVHPRMFSLAASHKAFDESGSLVDAKTLENLQRNLDQFVETL